MKPIIRTQWTAHETEFLDVFTGEMRELDRSKFYEPISLEPSLTVPDQSLTIKQILDRYARGLPLGGSRVPVYEPDSDLPDPRTLDLADREELALQYAAEIHDIRDRLEKIKIAKGDAEAAAAEKREAEQLEKIKQKLQDEKPKL